VDFLEIFVAGDEAVDGAKLVASGAVLFLLGDGGEVGEVVGGGHGDAAHPETLEGRVVVEQGVVFGVGVDEVEGGGIVGAAIFVWLTALFNVAEEAAEEWEFKGVEEEGEGGFGGEGVEGGVGVVEGDGGEEFGEWVALPEGDVGVGDEGEVGVELDAFDAEEGILRGEQEGTAFAGAYVKEDGLLDGGLGMCLLEPVVEEVVEDAGGDAVVGGEVFDLGVCALRDDLAGDETGGVGAVEAVEGVDGWLGLFAGHIEAGNRK